MNNETSTTMSSPNTHNEKTPQPQRKAEQKSTASPSAPADATPARLLTDSDAPKPQSAVNDNGKRPLNEQERTVEGHDFSRRKIAQARGAIRPSVDSSTQSASETPVTGAEPLSSVKDEAAVPDINGNTAALKAKADAQIKAFKDRLAAATAQSFIEQSMINNTSTQGVKTETKTTGANIKRSGSEDAGSNSTSSSKPVKAAKNAANGSSKQTGSAKNNITASSSADEGSRKSTEPTAGSSKKTTASSTKKNEAPSTTNDTNNAASNGQKATKKAPANTSNPRPATKGPGRFTLTPAEAIRRPVQRTPEEIAEREEREKAEQEEAAAARAALRKANQATLMRQSAPKIQATNANAAPRAKKGPNKRTTTAALGDKTNTAGRKKRSAPVDDDEEIQTPQKKRRSNNTNSTAVPSKGKENAPKRSAQPASVPAPTHGRMTRAARKAKDEAVLDTKKAPVEEQSKGWWEDNYWAGMSDDEESEEESKPANKAKAAGSSDSRETPETLEKPTGKEAPAVAGSSETAEDEGQNSASADEEAPAKKKKKSGKHVAPSTKPVRAPSADPSATAMAKEVRKCLYGA